MKYRSQNESLFLIATIMQNISETISNIPVHIGVQELKNIAYLTLLPPFIKWSKNDFLNISDLCLCFKDWVELIPLGSGNEDVDAITRTLMQFHPNFFYPKRNQRQYNSIPTKFWSCIWSSFSTDMQRF
jgi:hypothetical protein